MRRRRLLLGLLLVVLLAAIVLLAYFLRAKHAVTTYRRQLIAAGELMSVKELLPPAIREADNGATLFLKAMAAFPYHGKDLLETNPPQAVALLTNGRAIVVSQQAHLFSRGNSRATNSWEDLEHELARYAAGLAILDQLADKRTIDFRFDYNQGFEGLLPNLAPLKHASQILNYATILALHHKDYGAAHRRLRSLLALIRANQEERLVISQLVRFAIAHIAATAVWEYLQAPQLPDAELAELQQGWTDLEFAHATENAMMMERALGEMTMEDMRRSRAQFRKVANGWGGGGGAGGAGAAVNLADAVKDAANETWEGTIQTSRELTWRVAWSYPDQLRMLRGHQALLEAMRQFQTNRNYSLAHSGQSNHLAALGFGELVDNDSGWGADGNLRQLFSSNVQSLQKVLGRLLQAEAERSLLVTAIALKRYQLRHGQWPRALKELTPEFLTTIPIDPADGEPLRYQPQADGRFLLYSIGRDGRDDAGTAVTENPNSKSWLNGKDLVWPQAATCDEISAEEKSP